MTIPTFLEAMRDTKQFEESAEHRVAMDIQALTGAARALREKLLSKDPEVRAEVLRQELDLWPAAGIIRALLEEVRDTNNGGNPVWTRSE
jgi:hypothetical protein